MDLLGHVYTQDMEAQEGWLRFIYQPTSHYSSSPSVLAKTLASDLASSLSYSFHNPLQLKEAVVKQFTCPCNISLVGYSSEPRGLAFIGEKAIFLHLEKIL